jgi:hypothetical protein
MTPCEFFADATVLYAKRREQFKERRRAAHAALEGAKRAEAAKRAAEAKRAAKAKRISVAKSVSEAKRATEATRAADAKSVAGNKRKRTEQPLFGTVAELAPETKLHRLYRIGEISIDQYLYEREPHRSSLKHQLDP